jgi:hypothetical protein
MDHDQYFDLVNAAGCYGPAAVASIERAKRDPRQRVRNVINGRVLRFIHQMETGAGNEINHDGLQLI